MDATDQIRRLLLEGMVIPAHPLALTAERRLDERRQVALTRYYCDAGAGGIAVGVHTTQFAIREPRVGLFLPVLRLAADTASEHERRTGRRIVRVAGVCGRTAQTIGEALQYVPKARLIACTNCGMAPMRREIALRKLDALVQGAALARQRYA